LSQSNQLEGRVAIVTGGGRGIGYAIASVLVEQGASVVVADNGTGIDGRGEDAGVAQGAAAELGARAVPYPHDISNPKSAETMVELALESFGGLDIVINDAAILRDSFVFKSDPDDWDRVIAVNLSSAFYLLRAATPILRNSAKLGRGGTPYAWGRIVNLVSSAGLIGNLGQAAYASAKAGLFGLTRVAAMDMQRSGVTSNAVAPFAATRVTETIRPANDAQAVYKERALQVDPKYVGNFVAWLCGAEAQSVTGQLFGVRGRELFLFSQPRPVERIVVGGADSDDASYSSQILQSFAPEMASLTTDLEYFNTEPIT
jgi:NAD(P)-dependent dehydrogenase (short-subunit alcohol dehydrogenase family)